MLISSFPFIKQFDSSDCGFACIKMIGKYYNEFFNIESEFFNNSNLSRQGISINDLKADSKVLGFNTLILKLNFEKAVDNIKIPSIFFWNQNHFVVVYKLENNKIYVADPSFGKTIYTKDEFIKGWLNDKDEGIVLILEPTEIIFKKNKQKSENINLSYVTKYLKKHNVQLIIIAFTLLLSSCIELIFPFFTQKIIDKGVFLKDKNIIYLILTAQIIVFLSKIALEFYRSWLFIHISSRISISIISDFLIKLMKLPIRFFNSKTIGDFTQRIQDHRRIESFLSKDLIQTVFSFFNIIIYSAILLYFNFNIFLVVFISTIIELLWIFSFLEKIKINDHKNFSLQANDQNKIYELINAIQEIKLNNLEEQKTFQWQKIQQKLYHNNIEKLKLDQKYQSYRFINFFQTILVIFIASISVMNQEMTIGTMLSIMFILGGINAPINQVIGFLLNYQLVKTSFERLNDIHNKEEEENLSLVKTTDKILDISIKNINFSYDNKNLILNNIDLIIPKNKTTAIVGVSGSGKTTLLKLLLKFYKPQKGDILVGEHFIDDIDNKFWREKCGVILQDSIIFSDTIKYNICLSNEVDEENFIKAIELANIKEFINHLTLKENTIIGSEGVGISQGQRQRILIARAIYKNPDYLFFDEATNSLDSENEKIIINNINNYFKNKTMIVVAHRLSTVKNADQIIVLDNGKLIEKGNHNQLIELRCKYFELIKNQLELGE